MKRFLVFFILACSVFLIASKEPEKPTFPGVISHIEIHVKEGGQTIHYTVTEDGKIRSVLNYFRALDKHISAQNTPSSDSSKNIHIWVCLISGKKHFYQQIGTEFYRKDGGSWKVLEEGEGQKLFVLEKALRKNGKNAQFSNVF